MSFLTSDEVDAVLNHGDHIARWMLAQNQLIKLSNEQFEKLLNDRDDSVRAFAAKRTDFSPTKEQIKKGLKDGYEDVRVSWVSRNDVFLENKEIDILLNIRDFNVMSYYLTRENVKISEKYIDFFVDNRIFGCLRELINNPTLSKQITNGHVEKLFSSDESGEFLHLVVSSQLALTAEQVEQVLNLKDRDRFHYSIEIKAAYTLRKDCFLTREQCNRVLADSVDERLTNAFTKKLQEIEAIELKQNFDGFKNAKRNVL